MSIAQAKKHANMDGCCLMAKVLVRHYDLQTKKNK